MKTSQAQRDLKRYPRHHTAHRSVFGSLCASLILNLSNMTLPKSPQRKA